MTPCRRRSPARSPAAATCAIPSRWKRGCGGSLAEVLALAGKDARPELEQALALYERKGNLVMAERVRSML
jgi:hypothetical protein